MLKAGSVSVDDIVFIGDDNAKEHSIGDLHVSFDRFGVIQRVVVNAQNKHCIAGEGRIRTLRQARSLGKEPPDNIEVDQDGDWIVPCDFVDLEESEEASAAFILNASQDEGGYSQDRLAALLPRLAQTNKLGGSGWDTERVEAFVRFVTTEAEAKAETPSVASSPRKTIICPQCGYHISS